MSDLKKQADEALLTVMDPELHVSIVDLGLVYEVTLNEEVKSVHILMTLTTLGCPLFPIIEQEVHNKLYKIGIEDVKIELTFDPPWSMERMSESARAMLGI